MKTPRWFLPRALGFAGALLSASLSTSLPAAIPDSALPVAGTNMSVNKAQSVAVYWNDIIHSVDTWSATTPTTIPFDANGWPTDLQGSTGVFLPIFLNNGFHYPTGDYVLSWTGNGDLTLVALGGTPVTLKSSTVTTSGGRKVYTVADNTAASFKVKWISTAAAPNNVRNVHLWLPGKENSPNLITDTVAADLAPFEVLRMMDWGETNGNQIVSWADRPKVNGPIWDPVPYEIMVSVCNELNKDLWINVPAKVDDAFVTSLATYIRDNLNPGLVCWIEYSNEIWNFGSAFANQTNYVNNTFPGANLDERYAYRSGQIFNLFYATFGAQAPNRLMRVCGAQASTPSTSQKRLAALGANVDVLAITNYFGRGVGGGTAPTTVNQWIIDNWNNGALTFAQFRDYLKTTEIDGSLVPSWTQHVANATAAGVPTIAYEGGQHILDAKSFLTTAQQTFITDFQTSPEMKQAQRYALDRWRDIGAKTHMMYTNYGTGTPVGGFWGHRRFSGQPLAQAPKWAAVLDWIAAAAQPPTITTQPSNQTSSVGATATFTVAATSPNGGTLSYQWKKGATNVGTNSASYTTPTLTLADNGNTYSVVVTNTSGSSSASVTSNTATLTVSGSITETMANSNFPASAFGSGSFVGVGGLTWTYANAEAFTLNGKAAWLKGAGAGTLAVTPVSPVKSVSVVFMAKSATANARLELLVNGIVVATSLFQTNVATTWSVTGLTGAGNSEIKIRNNSGQSVVDDITLSF